MNRGTRPVKVGNCSGFYGDRMSALAEVVRGGEVDVITGDYLAEVTMFVLAKARAKDPALGYASTFVRQLEPLLDEIVARGVKVVVNAGGLNPAGLAARIREMGSGRTTQARVAHVDGDDLLPRLDELSAGGEQLPHLSTGKPLSEWTAEPLTANAYLGAFGIVRALKDGADVVVTGRVADASLVVGAAAWWWGWRPDDLDRLAGGVAAGHVIECGTQATGGNFSGFEELPMDVDLGFPIAEVAEDGSSVITKHPGTGGSVNRHTVTAQLLYEVGSPCYLNPDVVAHLDHARLREVGPDRVEIAGVRGSVPPPTTKVAITAAAGWQNSSMFVVTAPGVDRKIELIEKTVRRKVAALGAVHELAFTTIGDARGDSDDQNRGACVVKVLVRGSKDVAGRSFSSLLVEMALSTYPGHFQLYPPSLGSAYGTYWPGLVSQAVIEHRVVHHDGRAELVPPPPKVGTPAASPVMRVETESAPIAAKPLVDVVLGDLVHTRSGDKGGDANLGVWVKDPRVWSWLQAELTETRLTQFLPELRGLPVRRYEFPHLQAVNFYVEGLLGDGATSTSRLDRQAKALGEWLRSRRAAVPAGIVTPASVEA